MGLSIPEPPLLCIAQNGGGGGGGGYAFHTPSRVESLKGTPPQTGYPRTSGNPLLLRVQDCIYIFGGWNSSYVRLGQNSGLGSGEWESMDGAPRNDKRQTPEKTGTNMDIAEKLMVQTIV